MAPSHRAWLTHLRAETADAHTRVEDALALLAPRSDAATVARAVGLLAGFWVHAEADLDVWARRAPRDAATVGWDTRRRAATHLECARELCGAVPADRPAGLPPVPTTAHALGRLYVMEGSTLGGAVVHRALSARPELAALGRSLRCLRPYGDGTGPRWTALLDVIDAQVRRGDLAPVTQGAVTTFEALAAWCVADTRAGAGAGR